MIKKSGANKVGLAVAAFFASVIAPQTSNADLIVDASAPLQGAIPQVFFDVQADRLDVGGIVDVDALNLVDSGEFSDGAISFNNYEATDADESTFKADLFSNNNLLGTFNAQGLDTLSIQRFGNDYITLATLSNVTFTSFTPSLSNIEGISLTVSANDLDFAGINGGTSIEDFGSNLLNGDFGVDTASANLGFSLNGQNISEVVAFLPGPPESRFTISAVATSVPEPSSLAVLSLLGLGALSLRPTRSLA